jgi:hypothetical protein
MSIDIGDAHIEHGMQSDPMFRIDPDRMFVQTPSGPVLALPWGSSALLDVAMPMYSQLCDLDRLRPRRRVFELVPEFRDYVVGAFWRYWTRDGWRDWIGRHPVKRTSWSMLREIAYRFGTLDPDIVDGGTYRSLLHHSPDTRLVVVGHLHQSGWWTEADRKLLHTGCFRDEHAVELDGRVRTQIPKSWAEVHQCEGRTVRSYLVEADGPPSPPGHVPHSVFDVLPRIRPQLPSAAQRERERLEEAAQHHEEGGR